MRTGFTSGYVAWHGMFSSVKPEGRSKKAILMRKNRALCNHVVEGREVQMFVTQPRGRTIYHLGQAEYRRHAHYDNHDGTLCVMFELAWISRMGC